MLEVCRPYRGHSVCWMQRPCLLCWLVAQHQHLTCRFSSPSLPQLNSWQLYSRPVYSQTASFTQSNSCFPCPLLVFRGLAVVLALVCTRQHLSPIICDLIHMRQMLLWPALSISGGLLCGWPLCLWESCLFHNCSSYVCSMCGQPSPCEVFLLMDDLLLECCPLMVALLVACLVFSLYCVAERCPCCLWPSSFATYCLFGAKKIFFSIFNFYAWFGMSLKGMGEIFILSEDEPLTPNIDGVMALWIFRRRAQTAENRRKLDL